MFNTSRIDGGIHADTPVNVVALGNWWGDHRGPTLIGGVGKGDVITSGIQYIDFEVSPTIVSCIDYSAIYFDSPNAQVGQPGLAGEIYVRARQIAGTDFTIDDMLAFTLRVAGVTQFSDQLIQDRMTEAVGRKFFWSGFEDRLDMCSTFPVAIAMQRVEGIVPLDPNDIIVEGQMETILCTMGTNEWYGEDDWADTQAYAFVDFIQGNSQYLIDMRSQVELITGDETLRAQRGIDPNCLDWESGDGDGQLACPYEWGNFVQWISEEDGPRIQARRLSNQGMSLDGGNTTNSSSLLVNNTYSSAVFHSDPNGVEKGLEFRFAVNGSGKTGNFEDSDFFVLTVDQQATLYCPEKGSADGRRLWIFPSSSGNGYPLCRFPKTDGTAPEGTMPNIAANQP